MDKKLQCDKEVIQSLFSLLPLYLYIYTRRPSLLSHTGAVAQWRAMVAVAAMVPLTLISYPHMYIEYIRCASAVAQGRAMAAVDAMVPLTLLPLYLYKAPFTLIPYGRSGAMQGNGCSGGHGAPHSYPHVYRVYTMYKCSGTRHGNGCSGCHGASHSSPPIFMYIYTRRPSLLSHTGAVAQCKAMVAVDAMAPLTLTPMGSKTAHCYTPLAPMGSKAKICFTPVANQGFL